MWWIPTDRLVKRAKKKYLKTFDIWHLNKLDPGDRKVETYSLFRKNLLAFIRPAEDSIYSIYDLLRIKLLHRLRLEFSDLRKHKFRHNFADTMNPLCSCYLETDSTESYITRCHNYATCRTILMNELNCINSKFNTLELDELIRTILYPDKNFDNDSNFKNL